MLSSVTWSDFILYLTFLLIFYYGFVAIVFYRSEIAEYLKNRSQLQKTPGKPVKAITASPKDAFTKFQQELDEYFAGCAKLKPIHEELMMGLQSLVQGSPFKPDTKEKIRLHQYITESSQSICSIALDPGEVDRIWKR